MAIHHRYFFLVLLGTALNISGFAQQPQTIHGSESEMRLYAVVSQKNGTPVADLRQEDFQVIDNKTPATITSFRALGKDAPVSVVLLIDALNTGFDSISNEQQQLESFLRSNEGRLAHPTALAVFTERGVGMQQSYSTDGNALADVLKGNQFGLRTITRSTGFYGAAERYQLSLRALDRLLETLSTQPGRKIVLWVSPGWALFASPGIEISSKQQQEIYGEVVSFSNLMRRADVTLYSIDPHSAGDFSLRNFSYQDYVKGISKPNQAQYADLSLQVLAYQSGGLTLFSSNDIGALLRTCLDDTNAYYEISFKPIPGDPRSGYHSIEIKVDRPGVTVRTRNGYYSQQ